MAPTCQLCGLEGLRKGTMASASIFVWQKVALPALALMWDTLIPPHMALLPFELLPQHWNLEGRMQSKAVHRPFNRNCLRLWKPLSYSATLPGGFYSQKLWRLLFLVWDWDSLLLRGTYAPEISLPNFIHHTWVLDQLFCVSAPPTSLGVVSFIPYL